MDRRPLAGPSITDPAEATGAERPAVYTCRHDGCDKSFPRRDYRDRHEANHLQNRPYPCDECDKAYYRLDVLVRHQRTHHIVGGGSASSTPQRPRTASRPQVKRRRHAEREEGPESQRVDEETEATLPGPLVRTVSPPRPESLPQTFEFSDLGHINGGLILPTRESQLRTDEAFGAVGQEHEELMRLILPAKCDQPFYSDGTEVTISPSVPSQADHENSGSSNDRVIEESCRHVLSTAALRLDSHQQVLLERFLLPSYLDLCIELYFLHFERIRPVIHRPTLLLNRDSRALPWLVWAMVLVGSACSNDQDDVSLFICQTVFPSIQRAFSKHLRDHIRDVHLRELQAALLFSHYGLHYSSQGEQRIAMVEWPFVMELFRIGGLWHTRLELSQTMAWIEWGLFEQRKRLAHLALIMDSEMAPVFGSSPQMSYTRLATCLSCPDNVWSASSALDWALGILHTGILERSPDSTFAFFLSQDHFPEWIESVFEATFLLAAAISTANNRTYVLANAGPGFDRKDKESREQRSVLCWSWHQAFQVSFRDSSALGANRGEIRYHAIMLHHSNINSIVLRLGAGESSEVGPFDKVTPRQAQHARSVLSSVSRRSTGGFACVHAVGILKVALDLIAGEDTGDPFIASAVFNAALAIWHFATGPLDHSPPLTKLDRLCLRSLPNGKLYVEPSLARRRAQVYIEQYEPFIHPFQPGLCGIAPNRSYCVGLMAWAYMFLNDNRRPTLNVPRKTLLDLIMTCEL